MNADDCEYGDSRFCTERFVESPTARIAMTAATPMMMPSIVSSERVRLFHTTSSPSTKNSRILFMPEALDRLELAGAHRGIRAEKEPDGQRRSEREHDDGHPIDAGGDAGELHVQHRAARER